MRGIKLVLALFMVLVVVGCTTKGSQPESNNTVAHEAYSRLGFQYLQNGDTATAKQSFQRAIELNGGYAEAYNGLALTFQLEGDSELAETYFRKAIAVAPDSAMVHNNFGAFLFSNERYAEACEELARATEDPFYNLRSQAFENLGRCYRLLDRKEASVHAFKRALQVTANRPVSLVELSELYLLEGNYLEAENYFDRFLTLVENRRVDHYAKSLWVGIRLARHNREATRAATFALILKNLYPNSEEYRQYEESAR
ncbi:type IV pilus biogenesis/stability protein PilW [Neptuniibacter sp. 1_MG-2023]|uniref:type IV pilus biogenesis/stability protein PilW n=1 Tax=Neptuniibacter sp. 1_MG-2023 TaxID=3062662 RepID=UPI0026E1BF72|nr:type IV pilus biogenesis/stability protein PilW [Neptuniibacter sp. 1_MG-2023]MDO6594819.1 type IV pilus biogenesis/stability protein PilW [Neptuniibacter sp. 1_MG-2023]